MWFKKVSRVYLIEYLTIIIKTPENRSVLRVFLKQQIIIIIKTQCNKSVFMVFQASLMEGFKRVSGIFQGSYKGVSNKCKVVSRVFQGSLILRMF